MAATSGHWLPRRIWSPLATTRCRRLAIPQDSEQTKYYFSTSGLPSISSSRRQTPWDSRPETFFQLNPYSNSSYVTSFLTRRWVCLLWICLAFRKIAHMVCYWKFFLLHYIQVFCQYRHCKADHAYLTYLMLQGQLSHLNGRKLHHRQV
jgi:hypothetical protein